MVGRAVIPVGFPPVSPEQYQAWWRRIQELCRLARRLGLNAYLSKADPMRPLDVLNPNVLVVEGDGRKIGLFKLIARRRSLL